MKIFARCQVCHRNRFFIRKRVYVSKHAGRLTSQSEMCRGCSKNIESKID